MVAGARRSHARMTAKSIEGKIQEGRQLVSTDGQPEVGGVSGRLRSPWASPAKILGWVALSLSLAPIGLAVALCGVVDLAMHPGRAGRKEILFGLAMSTLGCTGAVVLLMWLGMSPMALLFPFSLILALLGYFWLPFLALQEKDLWAVGTFLVPVLWLYYGVTRWRGVWGPVLVTVVGYVLIFLSLILDPFSPVA